MNRLHKTRVLIAASSLAGLMLVLGWVLFSEVEEDILSSPMGLRDHYIDLDQPAKRANLVGKFLDVPVHVGDGMGRLSNRTGIYPGHLLFPISELLIVLIDLHWLDVNDPSRIRIESFISWARENGAKIVHGLAYDDAILIRRYQKLRDEIQEQNLKSRQKSIQYDEYGRYLSTLKIQPGINVPWNYPESDFQQSHLDFFKNLLQGFEEIQSGHQAPLVFSPFSNNPSRIRAQARAPEIARVEVQEKKVRIAPEDAVVALNDEVPYLAEKFQKSIIMFAGGDLLNCLTHKQMGIFSFFHSGVRNTNHVLLLAEDLVYSNYDWDKSKEAEIKRAGFLDYLAVHGIHLTRSVDFKISPLNKNDVISKYRLNN